MASISAFMPDCRFVDPKVDHVAGAGGSVLIHRGGFVCFAQFRRGGDCCAALDAIEFGAVIADGRQYVPVIFALPMLQVPMSSGGKQAFEIVDDSVYHHSGFHADCRLEFPAVAQRF